MRFEITLLAGLVTGCGLGRDPALIGQKLSDTTPLYNGYGINSDTTFLVDTPSQRILQVDLNTMTIKNAYSLSKPEQEHTLASGPEGAYVIDFSTQHLEFIQSDGNRSSHPFAFQGTPISAAFNPTLGTLAMLDDLQSIGLLKLSPSGEVLKSWLGGPLIGKDRSFLSGDLDSQGRLLLAVSDGSIAIVDVDQSINEGAWQSTSFATKIEEIRWLAPDHGRDHYSLVIGQGTLAVVDAQSRRVKDQFKFSKEKHLVLGESKLVKPHVLTLSSKTGRQVVHFIGEDGKFVSHELPQLGLAGYSVSYLDAAASILTVLFSSEDTHRVIQLRLSDNLIVLDETVRSEGDAQLGPNVLLINKRSQLGYLQAHSLRDKGVRELKGYNFDSFRGVSN